MSFKCAKCLESTTPNEACNKKTVKKREKEYYYTIVESRGVLHNKQDIINKQAKDIKLNIGQKIVKEYKTKGWEIDREIKLCTQCLAELETVDLRTE